MCIWFQHKRGQRHPRFLNSITVKSFHVIVRSKPAFISSAGGQIWVQIRLLSRCDHHVMISPKRVWGQSKGMDGGRGKGEGNFVILNLKANSCYYWPVLFFLCVKGGSCPFELFRRCDNGWMLRTYVERPLWLMEEKLHAGPSVRENTSRSFHSSPLS